MTDSAVRHAAILLIGTDERTLRIMTWMLLEAGYDLAKAETPADAIARADELTPAVIVLDGPLPIPQADVQDLRRAFPGARFIDLHLHERGSAHTDAEGHLHGPFHADDLLDLVKSLLTVSVGSKSAHTHP